MPSFIISTLSTTTQVLNTFETGIITASGSLITTDATAVELTGTTDLTVLGAIGQTIGGGIVSGTVAFPTIVVGQDGFIGNLGSSAIELTLSDRLILENAGTIRGETRALSVAASDDAATVNMTNSGLMASGVAVAINLELGTGRLNLFNSGDITGPAGAILLTSGSLRLTNTGTLADLDEGPAIQLDGALDDRIINSGTIFGAINLGAGNDRLESRAGFQSGGNVLGGAGADRIVMGAGENVVFGGTEADTLLGGADDDQLSGGSGADRLSGGDDDDTLNGGTGSDHLNGGAGADRFAYTVTNQGKDFIDNFDTSDLLVFSKAAFGNLQAGTIKTDNFLKVTSGRAAKDAEDRFIFNSKDDTLWFDKDGTGVSKAVLIADFTVSGHDVVVGDILIV